MKILGIDPGLRYTGMVLLEEEKIYTMALVKCRGELDDAINQVNSALDMMGQVDGDIHTVVEWPQIYKGARYNPNDLLPLAAVCGACIAWSKRRGENSTRVLPRQWKGQQSKETVENKLRGVVDCEQIDHWPKSQRNHLFDALGIAIYGLQLIRH